LLEWRRRWGTGPTEAARGSYEADGGDEEWNSIPGSRSTSQVGQII